MPAVSCSLFCVNMSGCECVNISIARSSPDREDSKTAADLVSALIQQQRGAAFRRDVCNARTVSEGLPPEPARGRWQRVQPQRRTPPSDRTGPRLCVNEEQSACESSCQVSSYLNERLRQLFDLELR